jgi:hypothetical protein
MDPANDRNNISIVNYQLFADTIEVIFHLVHVLADQPFLRLLLRLLLTALIIPGRAFVLGDMNPAILPSVRLH